MSLQLAAKHLESHGRGDDKVLVHMTHGEVKSLNDLAMAHGGQLTINPKTGLPEAGFLSAILPMVAGAGLMAVSGGTINPMTAGLIVGGLRTAQSGSLSKGIMAGFGAYGGANLGQTLALEGLNAPPPLSEAVESSRQVITGSPQAIASQAIPTATPVATPVASGSASNIVSPGSREFINAEAGNVTNLAAPVTQAQLNAANQGISDMNFGADSGMGIGSSTPYKYTAPDLKNLTTSERVAAMQKGFTPGNLGKFASNNIGSTAAMVAPLIPEPGQTPTPAVDKDMGQRYTYSAGQAQPLPAPDVPSYDAMLTQQGDFGRQQNYYPNQRYTPISNEQAKGIYGYANGGTVEDMSNRAMMGINTMYPMANVGMPSYIAPNQRMAKGGISDLGDYSDGGRLLRGPGDGVSDSIPAMIGKKQPARLADGEFVVPARIVSEIGNGSTEAGARKLYAMMDRIQSARGKTVGKGKIAKNTRADKYLPA